MQVPPRPKSLTAQFAEGASRLLSAAPTRVSRPRRRTPLIAAILVCLAQLVGAQSIPSREYIYLGGRAVAIEVPPVLSLSSGSSHLGPAAGSASFDLLNTSAAPISWSATVDSNSGSWLSFPANNGSLSSISGTVPAASWSGSNPGPGRGTITYQAIQNLAPSPLTGTITVTAQGFAALVFTVTQDGSGGLSISPTIGGFSSNGGPGSFQLSTTSTTAVYWNAIISDPSWITLNTPPTEMSFPARR